MPLYSSPPMKTVIFPSLLASCVGMMFGPSLLKADPQPRSASPSASAFALSAPPGVVAWWPGEGNAHDIVGANPGSAKNGVLFLPGLVGEAFALAGGAFIEIPDSANLNFTGDRPMTLELWAYRTGTGTAMELVSKRSGALAAEFELAFDSFVGLHFGSISLPWATSYAMTGVQLPLNQWWHLAGTFDGAELRFYINGELAAATPGHLGVPNAEPVRIGAMDYFRPDAFEGLLDEVTLYNRALSPNEIRAIYQAGAQGKTQTPAPPVVPPVAPPPGLVGWWPGDGTAKDAVGTHDGALREGAVFAPGFVGPAFAVTNGAHVEIPDAAALNFSGTDPMTLELWAYRTGTGAIMHLVNKRNHDLEAEYLLNFDPTLGLHFGSIRLPWDFTYVATGVQLPLRQWWHLAATFDGAQMRFYINGKLAGSAPGRLGPRNSAPLRLGSIEYTSAAYQGGGSSLNAFEGLLDEVSLYDRALGPEEIQAIYAAGASGKTKTLSFLEGPQSQVGLWGKSARFNVRVDGSGPFAFQWLKDGAVLPGATDATLLLTDLRFSDAGSYTVVVTGPGGSATSVPAQLTVDTAGVSLGLYAGLSIEGVPGRAYAIQYTSALAPSSAWITLTNITLASPVQLWIDPADTRAAGVPARLYRVVPAP